jgi:uncharacterized membrane protein YeaQ/YmgE (transglycosylase-associated protein family)
MGLIAFLILGLIAGFLARAIMPGPDPMGLVGTIVLGMVGSVVGGTLAVLLFEGRFDIATTSLSITGIIGAVIGALVVLWAWRAMNRGRATV